MRTVYIFRLLFALLLASGRGCIQPLLDCTFATTLVEGTEVFTLSGTLDKYVFKDDVYVYQDYVTIFVLKLDSPQNVKCFSIETDEEYIEKEVSEMQLAFGEPYMWDYWNSLVGRHVVVEGSLYHAVNGHHYTRILIDVEKIVTP